MARGPTCPEGGTYEASKPIEVEAVTQKVLLAASSASLDLPGGVAASLKKKVPPTYMHTGHTLVLRWC